MMKTILFFAVWLLATGLRAEYWTVDGEHLTDVKVISITAEGVHISYRNPNTRTPGVKEMTVPFEKLTVAQQAYFKRELQKIMDSPENAARTPGAVLIGIKVISVKRDGVVGILFEEKVAHEAGGAGTKITMSKTTKRVFVTGVKDIAPGEYVEGEGVEGAVVTIDGESFRSWKMVKQLKQKH